MGFKRVWDSSCPRVWDKWEADGVEWIIQDLLPKDDERAIQILLEHFCPDEIICSTGGVLDDPVSIESQKKFWRGCLSQRMTLGCYHEVNGTRTLVGFNVCMVKTADEKEELVADEKGGKAWKHVCDSLNFVESKADAFKLLGTDKVLGAMGLVVMKEYRGAKLGARLLNAREPLCRALGIKGTTTVFTGIAAQKLAAKCGFTTIAQVSLKELAEAGLNYPENEDRVLKLMVKKYE